MESGFVAVIILGAFKIVAFVFRSFLLHCHAEARSISNIAERDASCLSMTKATILNAPIIFLSTYHRFLYFTLQIPNTKNENSIKKRRKDIAHHQATLVKISVTNFCMVITNHPFNIVVKR